MISATRAILVRRLAAVMAGTLVLISGVAVVASTATPASAAVVGVVGHIDLAVQDANHTVTVSGWAYDQGSPGQSSSVDIYVDYRLAAYRVPAADASPDVDQYFGIGGAHRFTVALAWPSDAQNVMLVARPMDGAPGEVALAVDGRSLPKPLGHLDAATQGSDNTLTVAGWAYDQGSPAQSTRVDLYVDYRLVAYQSPATAPSPDVDQYFGIAGAHRFTITLPMAGPAHSVMLVSRPAAGSTEPVVVSNTLTLSLGARIIAVASRYLGYPYLLGAAGPDAFDCSGFVKYVYGLVGIAVLPNTAEAQRETVRIIPRSQAQPGDMIFYLAGGTAYHEAIYAGGNTQYAATQPGEGLVFQSIWDSNIQFGTDWH